MYNLMDVDSSIYGGLYTITIVVVGSFFLMNLILAVIIQAFIQLTKKELEGEEKQLEADLKRKQAAIISHIDEEEE